jgi:hypothetical protein
MKRKEEKTRCRVRWMDGVESDLRNMVVKRGTTRASDRKERAHVVRENEGKLHAVVLKRDIENNKNSHDRYASSLHLSPVEMIGHVPFCL